MRELLRRKVRFLTYGQRAAAAPLGISADAVLGAVEERAAFARFGAGRG